MLILILAVLVIVALTIWVLRCCQKARQRQLCQQLHQPLPLTRVLGKPELFAIAGLTPVELMWHWLQIDPQVIAAADFSSRESINNGFDFACYLENHISGMDAEAMAGFKHRLMGYVGEQKVSELLSEQGHVIEVAQTANQPIWDLMVDGQAVNVKTVQDIAEIKATALAHPDVTYVVPEDVSGTLTDNMLRLDGFNHHQMELLTEQAIIDSAVPDTLVQAASHLPVIPLFFSVLRNQKAMAQGRNTEVAIKHIILDTLGRGGGGGLGAWIGGAAGTIIGPVGVVIGSALGALFGTIFGAHWTEGIKRHPLQCALNEFDQHLQHFGAHYADRLTRVLSLLNRPYRQQQACLQHLKQQLEFRQQQKRWWMFPDFYTLLLEQSHSYAAQQLAQQQIQLAKLELQLTKAQQQGDYRPLAMLILNVPQLRELFGVDLIMLQHLQSRCAQVYAERSQLHPDIFPPKTSQWHSATVSSHLN